MIDPGHGGNDPGALANGLREADVNLRIAQALKAIFNAHPEYEATLTRTGDRTVPLSERTDLANSLDAVLVSIHCNATDRPDVGGAETWCFAAEDTDGKESAGHRLARAIQTELVALGLKDRGAKAIYDRRAARYVYRRLWVLRKVRRSSVLTECSFLTHPAEAACLAEDGFIARIAEALATGIRKGLSA